MSNSGTRMHNAVCLWWQLSMNVSIRQTSGSRKISDVSLHLHRVFRKLLTSAASFFVVQHARTSFLDTADVAKPKKRASGSHAESQMCDAVKAYTFLLYAPTECFPKTSRNDFLRRAMVLDFLLGSMPFVSTHRALQVVRTFLAKIISFLGSWEHEASGRYLHYLMTSPLPVSAEQVTRELVHGHLV